MQNLIEVFKMRKATSRLLLQMITQEKPGRGGRGQSSKLVKFRCTRDCCKHFSNRVLIDGISWISVQLCFQHQCFKEVSKQNQLSSWTDPHYGGLGATYTVHLTLIGKRVVDFLFALIEIFALVVTAEALGENFKQKQSHGLLRQLSVLHHSERLSVRNNTFRLTVVTPLCSNFLQAKCDFINKTTVLHFLSPPQRGLGVNVQCSSWAHWKARSGLIISVN